MFTYLFGDNVKIISGFYKGSEGCIINKVELCYTVELQKITATGAIRCATVNICHEDLELMGDIR